MELEDRVQALEDAMKILKKEIQSTLLNIQEQVLIHYYPSLRAAESPPPESIVQSLEAISEDRKRATEDDLTYLEEQPLSRSGEEIALPSFTELAKWAGDSVERIGKNRTREALETYTKGGYLAPKVKDMLLQLISLSDEEAPPEKVGIKDILDIFLELNKALGQGSDLKVALPSIGEESLG
jgi:hypothetical protein